MEKKDFIQGAYNTLIEELGPQKWWPADSPWEVIVGAILTQNTNWKNVRKAIENLKGAGLFSIENIVSADIKDISELIKPSGYFNQKAKKLKAIAIHIKRNYGYDLNELFKKPVDELRAELLSIWGIGKETADSIILYAAEKPVFVVDRYTIRILSRHGLIDDDYEYDDIQKLFIETLPKDTRIYNEYHALLVNIGKNYCLKKEPRCENCPLGIMLDR
ncbi:MAG: endonuclease [Candidatus Coatesbacteria bacterium 4484_99]|uniref:Endonuclease n=1 Tax=Candidatus Coatesbacteria bacterium 4484_99 TaxID=1970774 RepID=A0A1W9S2I6_9BACT|nr:MAG: endonuclease [Candidatus Coatesbacteria bacterium 4484_99]